MDNAKIKITLWIFIIFVLIAGGYILGFFAYKEYEENFNRQAEFTLNKFENLENNLKKFSTTFENTLDKNKIERKKALSQMQNIKEALKDVENKYKAALSEMRMEIEGLRVDRLTAMVENMQQDINELKKDIQDLEIKEDAKGVDLGRISVEKEGKEDRKSDGKKVRGQ